MATMAAYLVQQGGQPVGSGQTALLTSHPSDHAAALAGPNVPTSEFCESNRRSLRPAPSSHPEIKGAVSVRRYECVAALRRFDSSPVSSNFGDLMADAPIPIETPGVRSTAGDSDAVKTHQDAPGSSPESRLVHHLDARLPSGQPPGPVPAEPDLIHGLVMIALSVSCEPQGHGSR